MGAGWVTFINGRDLALYPEKTMTDDEKTSLARRAVLGITGVGVLGLGSAFGSTASEHQGNETDTSGTQDTDSESDSQGYDAEEILDDWPEKQTETAREMMDKYGDPDEAVPSRLMWHQEDDDSRWKHTTVLRDAVQHDFPVEHPDYLEQTVDLYIPPHHYDKVAKFDGSVILERTRGEVTARCDKEAMNMLAINLTYELAFTSMTVEEARRAYAEDATAFMNGDEPDRTQDFQFQEPLDEERDPDTTVVHDDGIEQDQAIGEVTHNETTD